MDRLRALLSSPRSSRGSLVSRNSIRILIIKLVLLIKLMGLRTTIINHNQLVVMPMPMPKAI
jgi:hypothetical protein